ncbi:hypothetical protein [Agrobacterium sp. NPDC089420]|uniref:hypothetical protein n=1 Tax=Agrobacterium sp. NPDC089420 TaxID=3363918 RepID=UPI00384C445F
MRQVLICLQSPKSAARIQAALSQYGLAAIPVSLTERPYETDIAHSRLVVTYTAMVGRVRTAFNLPIVNIEAFMFEKQGEASSQPIRHFDGAAFVKRVLAIINSERRFPS